MNSPSSHLNSDQIGQWTRHELPPVELRELSNHVAECPICRQKIDTAMKIRTVPRSEIVFSNPEESSHLTDQRIIAYVDGSLPLTESNLAEHHLKTCAMCHAQTVALREFQATMAGYNARNYEPAQHESLVDKIVAFFAGVLHPMVYVPIGATAALALFLALASVPKASLTGSPLAAISSPSAIPDAPVPEHHQGRAVFASETAPAMALPGLWSNNNGRPSNTASGNLMWTRQPWIPPTTLASPATEKKMEQAPGEAPPSYYIGVVWKYFWIVVWALAALAGVCQLLAWGYRNLKAEIPVAMKVAKLLVVGIVVIAGGLCAYWLVKAYRHREYLAAFQRGVIDLNENSTDAGLSNFNLALQLEPTSARTYALRAEAKLMKGDRDGASADVATALRLNPSSALAYNSRAMIEGDTDAALADQKKAAELDPTFPSFYTNLGKIKLDRFDFSGALVDLSRAIEMDPTQEAAFSYRGIVRSILGDQAGALEDGGQAIALSPSAVNYVNRGVSEGKTDAGLADFTKAIQLDPSFKAAFIDRAQVKTLRGDFPGAIADYDVAIQLEPLNGHYYGARGRLEFQTQRWSNAEADFSKSLAFKSNAPDYFNRGVARYHQNNFRAALSDFLETKRLAPKDPLATRADVYIKFITYRLNAKVQVIGPR